MMSYVKLYERSSCIESRRNRGKYSGFHSSYWFRQCEMEQREAL